MLAEGNPERQTNDKSERENHADKQTLDRQREEYIGEHRYKDT